MLVKMLVHQDNVNLEKPVLCSECDDIAFAIFFEKEEYDQADGYRLSLEQLYAKCLDHMLLTEMSLQDVIDL
jgi:hypothetical protein